MNFDGGTKMVQKSVKKYENSIIKNPTTIKLLAEQIKLASDAYISKQIDEKTLREIIYHFAKYHGSKLFSIDGGMNPTIINRIGKKRLKLLNIMLDGFQTSLF